MTGRAATRSGHSRAKRGDCAAPHPSAQRICGTGLALRTARESVVWLQVRAGLGAMPAFSEREISNAELDALYEYLKEGWRS